MPDGGEQKHAAHAPQQNGADGVGDFPGLGLNHRCGGDGGRHPAHAEAGGKHAGHGVGAAHAPAHEQNQPHRTQHEKADHHHRQRPELGQFRRAVEGAEQNHAALQKEARGAHAVGGPGGDLEHVDDDDARDDAHHHIVQVEYLGEIPGEGAGVLNRLAPVGEHRVETPAHNAGDEQDECHAGHRGKVVI